MTSPTQSQAASAVYQLPARLGRYTLIERVGVGGMAEVFVAVQDGPVGFQKHVVVKRILPHLAEDPHFVEMFQREAKLAASLSHTNVVQVYELGSDGNAFFIASRGGRGARARASPSRSCAASSPTRPSASTTRTRCTPQTGRVITGWPVLPVVAEAARRRRGVVGIAVGAAAAAAALAVAAVFIGTATAAPPLCGSRAPR